ncbi:MAG: two-component system, sensor histidine kinase and response regulator [Clostridiales bacterium]|jgi:signal transduction histidine kinase|nr:two-component system, sensor histidine kinase and response regulator [Clostridiales bacterium]MDN5281401.1 two-component system, sensor histidine kinase and response regulator [Candidatus Ozemobacter sp.]
MSFLKVLVIDDEPGMRMGVERTLDGEKLEFFGTDLVEVSVASAGTGAEGIEKINSDGFDILFLDYKLPDMNGLEVIEALGDRAKDLIIIMITAYASIEVAIDATKKGAYDFLPKPFTPGELKIVTKKAAERILLARKNEQLAHEKKQVRFEFIRVLGHELKAPLAAVEGYLDLMESKTLGENIESYEKILKRSSVRLNQMRKLIVDLLDMTKIESGKKDRKLVELNLREVAENAIELAGPSALARKIKIELDSPEKLVMKADSGELDMIFNNLVSNAVKYNRDEGKVMVRLEKLEEQIKIQVSDTGIGMTEEEQKKLFKEFSRIRNAKTADILGSGLGLSILKRLVELYEGEILVDSVPDQGTTFTLIIPNKE